MTEEEELKVKIFDIMQEQAALENRWEFIDNTKSELLKQLDGLGRSNPDIKIEGE